MSVKRVLEGAVEIVQNGWIQNAAHNEDRTAYCVLGALEQAAGIDDRWNDHALYKEAELMLKKFLQRTDIFTWNDDPARTKEDVILALKQTAHQLTE